jgi:hypothetical protein
MVYLSRLQARGAGWGGMGWGWPGLVRVYAEAEAGLTPGKQPGSSAPHTYSVIGGTSELIAFLGSNSSFKKRKGTEKMWIGEAAAALGWLRCAKHTSTARRLLTQ